MAGSDKQRNDHQTSTHRKILTGFVLGALVGVGVNQLVLGEPRLEGYLDAFIANVTSPVGQIFLNLLFMVVVPIVFCSIALGVAQLGNVQKLGRLSTRTIGFFLGSSALSALLGLMLVLLVRPGNGFSPDTQAELVAEYRAQAQEKVAQAEQEQFWPDVLVGIVSRNPLRDAVELNMLPVIFTSIIFGVALTRIPEEKSLPVRKFLDGVGSATVVIVGFAMRIAPVAVFALIFDATARFGWEIFQQLSLFVLVVILGYLLYLFVGYGFLVQLLSGLPATRFSRKVIPIMVTALSTSSSSATLPTTIKVSVEELGIPKRLAGFVLPLGATMNMNGTSLFVTVVVVFLAQVFGVELSLTNYAVLILFAVLTAVGAAGVPSGSLPIIIVVLIQMGIPGEGLALVLGVERILDMGRTVVNVTGDAAAACYVASAEAGEPQSA